MIAVDDKTIDYLQGPAVRADGRAVGRAPSRTGARCVSDEGAQFDTRRDRRRATSSPQVTWGTSPEMVVSIEDRVPDPDKEKDADAARRHRARAGLHGAAAEHADDRHRHRQGVHRLVHQLAHRGPARRPRRSRAASRVAGSIKLAMVVPGSGLVKAQAEARRPRPHLPRRGLRVARARAARCASR